jgi:hypothetical protein
MSQSIAYVRQPWDIAGVQGENNFKHNQTQDSIPDYIN